MKKSNLFTLVLLTVSILFFGSCFKPGHFKNDVDNDGVADENDLCEATPKGETVDENGCALNYRTYVPDGAFEQFLIDKGYDDVLDDYVTNANVDTVELLSVRYVKDDESMTGITDLRGLEAFVAISNLSIFIPLSDQVDISVVSKLPNLKSLYIEETLISPSVITEYRSLEYLGLRHFGNIEELDVNNNPELQSIEIDFGGPKNINISENPKLQGVSFFEAGSGAIMIHHNNQLVSVSNNDIRGFNMDLSNNKNLSRVSIDLILGGGLYESDVLDLSGNLNLIELRIIDGAQFTVFDVSEFNKLETLDVKNNPLLTYIEVNESQLNNIPEGWQKDGATSYALECTE